MYSVYEVKEGDTLNSIAAKLGINDDVLATLNGVNMGSMLIPNSYIVIPSGNSLFDKYTVKKGDTIYQIARNLNLNPTQLLKLNGLNSNDVIYANQEILIPREGVEFYVTNEGDTLRTISENLNLPISEILGQNATIYLLPDQLIIYRR